jgi:enoyl-CoA hydratase/carnithine racemase
MSAPNVTLSWQGPEGAVAVITMDAEENRFDLDVVRHWHGLIDQVAAKEGPLALVTTGTGKFYHYHYTPFRFCPSSVFCKNLSFIFCIC